MSTTYFIAGCGYSGHRLAQRLAGHGDVIAIARRSDSTAGLAQLGIETHVGDLGTASVPATDDNTVVVYLAPPPAHGDRDATLEAFLLHAGKPARIVYVSTSGVYGDCQGALVDEDRPAAPKTARAIRRLAAEQALTLWCGNHDVESVVLRVAGIYGPQRLPIDRIRRREPVLREADAGPGNRIHVDDLVSACVAAAANAEVPAVINVSDGIHASSTAYSKLVARLANLPAPPEISLEEAHEVFTPMRWSFLAESRRLDNTRLREQLKVQLRYDDLESGIRASLTG